MSIPIWAPWLCFAGWMAVDAIQCLRGKMEADAALSSALDIGMFCVGISILGVLL